LCGTTILLSSVSARQVAEAAREEFFISEVLQTMATGTIKKLISDRGFGFITADDGKDYFFHRDGLSASLDFDRLTGGEKVSFDVESSPRGPRATNVRAE